MSKVARRRERDREDMGLAMLATAEKALARDGHVDPVMMVIGPARVLLVQYEMPEDRAAKRRLLMRLGATVGFAVDAMLVLAVVEVWAGSVPKAELPYEVPPGGLKDDPGAHSEINVFEVDVAGIKRQIERSFEPKVGGGFLFGPVNDRQRGRRVDWRGGLFEAFFAGKISIELAVEARTTRIDAMREYALAEAASMPGVVILDEEGKRLERTRAE
jgi:hypothetical protein